MRMVFSWIAIVVGLWMGALFAPATAAPGWPIPPGVKTVEVNGYPIAYIEAGAGVPVVMLHASWVDYRIFAAQVAAFSKTQRAIAVSLRHHYPEPWDGKEGAYSVSQHAADVAAMIRSLNLGKVHLLGHSRGGAVAIHVARQAPELIRTLILEDAAGLEPLLADESVARKRVEGSAKVADGIRELLQGGDRNKTAQTSWTSFSGPGAWEHMTPQMQGMITDNIGTWATKTPYDVPAIGCDDIRKFNFPIQFLHGQRSQKLFSDMEAAMRECKPNIVAETSVVPGAGHNMHDDTPAFFNQAVLDFVQRH